ncbi:MAG: hypothetical protein QOJ02_2907, partial [Acidobacteriota bacterium]|nr:hypothetical protein [Acidobacteriota bacterium]
MLLCGLLLSVCLLLTFAQKRRTVTTAERQRRVVGTKTINVRAGDNLQKAINEAIPGDTILLEAGASFTGPFTLPNKGVSSEWITIRTSTLDSSLPSSST